MPDSSQLFLFLTNIYLTMKYILGFLISIFLLTISCGTQERKDNSTAAIDSIQTEEQKIQSKIKTTLSKTSREALKDWEEFEEVDDFILNYYNISISDALSLSSELNDLVTLMRDSVRVEKLNVATVNARLNVLQNETLRLRDMSNINSITSEEVTQEVQSILEVYDSFLSKINTIYKAEELQKALEFDPETPVKVPVKPEQRIKVPPRRRTSIGS